MKREHLCLLGVAGMALLMAGCSASSAKRSVTNMPKAATHKTKTGLKKIFRNPFAGQKREEASAPRSRRLDTLASADDYASEPDGSPQDGGYSQLADARTPTPVAARETGPDADDQQYMNGLVEGERRQLQARLRMEEDKLLQYEDEQVRRANMLKELRDRRVRTTRRLRKLEQYKNYLEAGEIPFARAPAAAAYRNDNLALAPEGDWRRSVSAAGANESAGDFRPSVRRNEFRRGAAAATGFDSGLAGPPVDPRRAPAGRTLRRDVAAAATASLSRKSDTVRVLAREGHGQDAKVIISAGSAQGVKRGMFFAIGDPDKPTAVLVVDKVYPTYARAYPHPKYGSGNVAIRDRAKQIMVLP